MSGLPRDLLAVAGRRLGLLALVTMGVALVNVVVVHLIAPALGIDWRWGIGGDLAAALLLLVSLALYGYTRRTAADPVRLVDVGLGYVVFLCAASAFLGHYFYVALAPQGAGPRVSWTSTLLIFFPAIVPTTPRRTAVAGLLGATMDPAVMGLAMATGRIAAPASALLWMHFPNYICVGLGVVVSHVITSLGREVRDARDVGSYRLGRLLGRGGMGEVYRADHRMLVRPAAIKLIRPDARHGPDQERAIERFRREAQAVALLRSPHTVELYDYGVTDDGTFFFVMELLDGIDLASFVERFGPMPSARAAAVLRQVCDSLAEAHAQELVHRDVKPANIHLCRLGLRHDFVKVLDFGLVKARRPEQLGGIGHLTAADVVAGTPAFMAPEAALGNPLDARADIYGVGCVGYWLLTGQLVFEAASPHQLLTRHIEDPPVPPSRRAEHVVPPELDALILECLEKDTAHRPDAADLSRRLAAYAERDPWTEEHAAAWWSAHLPEGSSDRGADPLRTAVPA